MEFFSDFWNEALKVGVEDLLHIVLRTFIVFLVVLLVFRLTGERSVAQLDIFGLMLIVGLGSAVGDPMFYRDVNVTGALLAVAVVIAGFKILTFVTARFRTMDRFLTPEPVHLIDRGQLVRDGLRHARISEHELMSLLRLGGAEEVSVVKTSFLEVNGQVSVILFEKRGQTD